ncbi:MAG: hypothetical protein IJI98_06165 [Methanosphaera sp.]|uniref:hypothetical protein n=1 Tax=Methanosphaera sp. ISO3-F5 TaxID=1452353 RepID=UPI002B256975|nr:hypothetical protein [Methanosphaera sp. ISO3-F5]MBR0472267.1 hypothetical protein [Methanosphaera sp.]WQH64669.1 hypothetical protein PXD04_02415 [Methanosphaera sp. ISO3-F5]
MDKKIIIILSVILLVGNLSIAYAMNNDLKVEDTNSDEILLPLSMSGPIKLDELIKEIKTKDYYKGYDEQTLQWMTNLGDKYVYMTNDSFVIMNQADAKKIPMEIVTDVYITYNIKCKLIESHPLGNTKYPKNVQYVHDVKYINQDITYFEV